MLDNRYDLGPPYTKASIKCKVWTLFSQYLFSFIYFLKQDPIKNLNMVWSLNDIKKIIGNFQMNDNTTTKFGQKNILSDIYTEEKIGEMVWYLCFALKY